VTSMTVERRGIMSGGQIDKLCQEWLRENYGEEIASEYTTYSLVIPMWNPADLNEALEDLRLELCLVFGPDQSFESTDYYEARERLGLSGVRTPIPDVFVIAFAAKSTREPPSQEDAYRYLIPKEPCR
jgi:hypothetical protein